MVKRALIVVDVQNDFCPPNGSLAVKEGDLIVDVINRVRKEVKWDLVVLTQDFHPSNHCSFASNNKGSVLFELFEISNGNRQVMWPDHCVQGTPGCEFHPRLFKDYDSIVKKGTHVEVDSYSGFMDNDRIHHTELKEILKTKSIDEIYVCGLATDFCAGWTTIDGIHEGFSGFFITDASRGVSQDGVQKMYGTLKKENCTLITSEELIKDS